MGALNGVKVIELSSLGPVPFCGMMLADHGAEVIRIDRLVPQAPLGDPNRDLLNRSRGFVRMDLRSTEAIKVARRLIASADALIEGFRPGVLERLGLAPELLMADNPRLVVGRMTGWGQNGPYATMAGHDINYVAINGALHACGNPGSPPEPPLNLVGDFGGGGMLLAFGVLAGILSARSTGKGQIVDASMVEGSALLMTSIYSFLNQGLWKDERGTNVLDGAASFYATYETRDGRYVSVGAVEPQFYRELLEVLGLDNDPEFCLQDELRLWPKQKARMAAIFATRTRDEWCEAFRGRDACFAPVMSLSEAPHHPHCQQRQVFVQADGGYQPAPAPKLSVTPAHIRTGPQELDPFAEVLPGLGYTPDEIAYFRNSSVFGRDHL